MEKEEKEKEGCGDRKRDERKEQEGNGGKRRERRWVRV